MEVIVLALVTLLGLPVDGTDDAGTSSLDISERHAVGVAVDLLETKVQRTTSVTVRAQGNVTAQGVVLATCPGSSCSVTGNTSVMRSGCSISCLPGCSVSLFCVAPPGGRRSFEEIEVDNTFTPCGRTDCSVTVPVTTSDIAASCVYTDSSSAGAPPSSGPWWRRWARRG